MTLDNTSIAFTGFTHDPICYLTAPVSIHIPTLIEVRVWQFAQEKCFSRIVGIFASFTALIDCIHHIGLGLGIYFYNDLRRFLPESFALYLLSDVHEIFKRAAFYAVLTLIGSIIGVIYPEGLKFFSFSPSTFNEEQSFDNLLRIAPEELRELANRARLMPADSRSLDLLIRELRVYWNNTCLRNKDLFIRIFSVHEFANIRTRLASTVFKNATPPNLIQSTYSQRNRDVRWLSTQEVDRSINRVWEDANNNLNKGFYFHAVPTLENLGSILRNRKVEVRHEKLFKGAFVSNKPETGLGKYILVFKKTQIERLSKLEHGFNIIPDTYWAGFSENIPVDENSLAYIILENENNETEEIMELKRRYITNRVREWSGRDIQVISREAINDKLRAINNLNRGIPIEWPGASSLNLANSAASPNTIIQTLRQRALAAMEMPVTYHTQAVSGLSPQQTQNIVINHEMLNTSNINTIMQYVQNYWNWLFLPSQAEAERALNEEMTRSEPALYQQRAQVEG